MASSPTRLSAPLNHSDPAEHRRLIAMRANAGMPTDGTAAMQAPLRLVSFTVSELPDATLWEGSIVYVSDGSAGQKVRYSDGSTWISIG